jgi:hypothetical protein
LYTPEASIAETTDCIDFAITQLAYGDVLLLEVTLSRYPVEIYEPIRDKIRAATQRGIIVIEPAGNRNANLDDYVDDKGQHIFNRTLPGEFEDSGAIFVGASSKEHPHVNWHDNFGGTNFGTRIDCYAWGEGIVTTGSHSRPKKNNAYYKGDALFDGMDNYFGGTSGAAAIIAGACLLVQNLQTNPAIIPLSGRTGKLGPDEMRRMLRKQANGTEPLFLNQIGIMPDFNKILAREYITVPFL